MGDVHRTGPPCAMCTQEPCGALALRERVNLQGRRPSRRWPPACGEGARASSGSIEFSLTCQGTEQCGWHRLASLLSSCPLPVLEGNTPTTIQARGIDTRMGLRCHLRPPATARGLLIDQECKCLLVHFALGVSSSNSLFQMNSLRKRK